MKKLKISLKAAIYVGQIAEKKSEMEENIDLEVEYCPELDVTEYEFQPKEKLVVVRETPQEIPETQEKEDEKSVKPNSILVNETLK